MKISVIGLGYVGTVTAGCLAEQGHEVIGVDVSSLKVAMINGGESPVIEAGLGDIIASATSQARLRASSRIDEAIENTDLSMICVGTPSQLNGSLDLRYVRNVCEQIGAVLKDKADYHVVAVRSTMLPGSMRTVVMPTLEEASGKRAGLEFGICVNPEFLREGSAVNDFRTPPKTVIGAGDGASTETLCNVYSEVDAPLICTDIETAEMVKYTDNVWHALKVGFANEIGNICKTMGVDGHRVMEVFCRDTKLNLSPYYLKPGFAFGGSCLPKDVRALTYKAKSVDLDLPILNAILPSNERQVARGLKMIMDKGVRRIGVLGLSFKAGTDDLRESPLVELIERLLGKGYDVRVFDRNVNIASLVGANRDYILNQIPHISRIMVGSVDEIIEHSEVIVVGNGDPSFSDTLERLAPPQSVVDLVHVNRPIRNGCTYDGICW